MRKRGQVTLFVIIALIVFIAVLILLFLLRKSSEEKPPVEEEFKETYDPRINTVITDINFCMNKLAKEAFIDIGLQGGYLDVSNYRVDGYFGYENTALELFPGSGIIVPYWVHVADNPDCFNCQILIDIPSLQTGPLSIKSQVENYIDENLLSCLNNFESYENLIELNYSNNPKSNIIFRENDVFIGLRWPINYTFANGVTSYSSGYSNTLDLNFRNIFGVARDIIYQLEMYESERKLEDFTIDVLNYISLGGRDAVIPPMYGPIVTEIEAPRVWFMSDVRNVLKEEISNNIGFFQVMNSKEAFYPFTQDPYQENIYMNFQNIISTNDAQLSKTKVDFNYYPIWPMYVRTTPNSGELVMPEASFTNILFLTMGYTRYRFEYDLVYPVLVTLHDDTSLNEEGYTFQFAYEVNVRKSRALSNETIEFSVEENLQREYGSFGQRTVPVKVKIVNGYDLTPIEGVTLTYTCGDIDTIVGESKLVNGESIIDSLLQPCIGGYFEIFGRNYAGARLKRDILLDSNVDATMLVYPIKEFQVRFAKRYFYPKITEQQQEQRANEDYEIGKDREWELIKSPTAVYDLIDDEEVALILTEIRDGEETNNIRFVTYVSGNSWPKIELNPGLFKLQIFSLVKFGEGKKINELTIPRREYEVPDDFWSSLGITGGETVVINETKFNESLLLGGILLDNSTSGYLVITEENLFSTNIVTFYYSSYDLNDLRYVQDLSILANLDNSSLIDRSLFLPKFQ